MKRPTSDRLARAYRLRRDLYQTAVAWLRHGSLDETADELLVIFDRLAESHLLKTLCETLPHPATTHLHGQWWSLLVTAVVRPQDLPDYPDKKFYPAWEPLGLSFRAYAEDLTRQWTTPVSARIGLILALAEAPLPLTKLPPLLAFLEGKFHPEAGPMAPLLVATAAVWAEKGVSPATILGCWKALADQGVDDRDVATLWYDPAVDTRQKAAFLTIQLSILPKVVNWFRQRDAILVPRILRITRDFLRISGLPNSRHLAVVLKTFQEYWYVDLAEWVEEGAKLIRLHGDRHPKVIEWFQRTSEGSKQLWQRLDSAIHFAQARESTSIFLTGLLERSLPLVPNSQGSFWTDNIRIGLPDHYSPTRDREQNQMLWRHSCAHEAAHLLYGSFSTDRPRFQKTLRAVQHRFPDLYEERRHDIPRLQNQLVDMLQKLLEMLQMKWVGIEVFDLFSAEVPSSLTLMLHFPRVLEAKFLHNVFEDWRIERQLYRDFGGLAKERAEKSRIEATLRKKQTTEDRAQELVDAVVCKVLFEQDPPRAPEWSDDWLRIEKTIEAFQAREGTDVWDSWLVTAEVCTLIDASFRRANATDWDLSRDVPFDLIVDSVKLLIESRLGRNPEASRAVQQAAQVLSDHLSADLARFLDSLLDHQNQSSDQAV